jgi:hypothetical protein
MLFAVIFLIDSSSFSWSYGEEIENDFKNYDVLPHSSGCVTPDYLRDAIDICQSTPILVLVIAFVIFMVEVEDVKTEIGEDYNNINNDPEEEQTLIELGSVFVQDLVRFKPPHAQIDFYNVQAQVEGILLVMVMWCSPSITCVFNRVSSIGHS